jgi:hypothetical protein
MNPSTAQTEPSAKLPANAGEVPQRNSPLAKLRLLSWSSLLFALLQSICTAVIAISGVRVAIGLAAGFHQDAIRILMMITALLGALINLFVIWRIRSLRSRPASQWRQIPVTQKKLNSERFQIALSVVTLILLAAEWITHPMVHRWP